MSDPPSQADENTTKTRRKGKKKFLVREMPVSSSNKYDRQQVGESLPVDFNVRLNSVKKKGRNFEMDTAGAVQVSFQASFSGPG